MLAPMGDVTTVAGYLDGLEPDRREVVSAVRDVVNQALPEGRKLDMGQSCLRFKKLADLDLDLIAEVVASTSVEAFIEQYEKARR